VASFRHFEVWPILRFIQVNDESPIFLFSLNFIALWLVFGGMLPIFVASLISEALGIEIFHGSFLLVLLCGMCNFSFVNQHLFTSSCFSSDSGPANHVLPYIPLVVGSSCLGTLLLSCRPGKGGRRTSILDSDLFPNTLFLLIYRPPPPP